MKKSSDLRAHKYSPNYKKIAGEGVVAIDVIC